MTVATAVPDSAGEAIFTSGAGLHPPAGPSPGVKLKPDPVQLLFELRLVGRREVLLHQVFMSYLQANGNIFSSVFGMGMAVKCLEIYPADWHKNTDSARLQETNPVDDSNSLTLHLANNGTSLKHLSSSTFINSEGC